MNRSSVESALDQARIAGVNPNFDGRHFAFASYSHLDFRGASMRQVDLSGALAQHAKFSGADLRGAVLPGAVVHASTFSGADLSMATLDGVDARGVCFDGATLAGACFRRAHLEGSSFRGADVTGVDWAGADLGGVDFTGAVGLPEAPVVPDLDRRILEELERFGGALDMRAWHTDNTVHCLGGWAIRVAGQAGAALEEELGPSAAAAFIYWVSTGFIPDFYASGDMAMAALRGRAAMPTNLKSGDYDEK